MRKSQKQEILEMAATLNEAHEEVKNNIQRGNYAGAQSLLAQCQECAISIGNAIERSEGEGFATVQYIEEYCDAIFHEYEEIGSANANKTYKNLRKQLLRIENSVRNDIPIRKEVVFFPYKASMWDSLESVYLKAKEDPTCDAYCVPIPYYDVNPDGSLGQMHYEGREYPKNIEVVDWEKYDLENRKPDVAYIHNPYDDCNLVTRVHARFFSSNLKKYVDELVYIPYFILAEIEPDNQKAIDGMKHFIWLPGVVHADKVIVQSEKMAQIYRNEFRKAAIANGLPEKYTSKAALEKKILGLGSPKIEKVKNTKKEDLEIPQEWQKIINKPDGSRKKIVFYNTSVGALLANNEKMLEKMKDVFRIFKENKDEIALLWRPHPLIENTVKAMRPQLWNEYKKIVEQYKAEGWGIYDDTADMDRAVVLSDAYYGDGSSVVQLYQQTGKPVMMQAVGDVVSSIRFTGGMYGITVNDRVCVGNTEYVLSEQIPALLAMRENGKTEIICCFDWENMGRLSYMRFLVYKNKIILIPFSAENFAIYDVNKKTINLLPVPELERQINQGGMFGTAVMIDQYVYAFGYAYRGIIKVNMETLKTEVITDYLHDYEQIVGKENDFIFGWDNCVVGHLVYIPVLKTNYICSFNLKTQSVSFHEIGSKKFKLRTVCNIGDSLWIAEDEGNIIQWSISEKKINSMSNYNNDDVKTLHYSWSDGEHLYLVNCEEVKIYTFVNSRVNNDKRKRLFVDENLINHVAKKVFDKEKLLSEGAMHFGLPFLVKHLKI